MASAENSNEPSSQTYTIEASVPTGFESVAAEEAKETFQTECRAIRGKITFETPAERVTDILKLGGVDHCRAQILHLPHFSFTSDPEDCLSRLQLLVKTSDWAKGLEVWRKFCSFDHPIAPQPDTIPTDEELIDICYSVHMPGRQSQEPGHKKKNRRFKRKDRPEKGRGRPGHNKQAVSEQTEPNGEAAEKDEASVTANAGLQDPDLSQSQENGVNESSLSVEGNKSNSAAFTTEGQGDGKAETQEKQEDGEAESPVKKLKNGDPSEACCDDASSKSPEKTPEDHSVSCSGDSNLPAPEALTTPADTNTNAHHTPQASPEKAERKPRDPTKPVFRVTCKRAGENHCFDSMSAAASFGSAVQRYFGWSVDMTNYNIEVMLTIDNHEVSVGLTLTPESLHKRNLVAFGVTTLRPTICHNMLRMVKIKPGHVVCDPLCGTASIPIQGALRFPAFQLCGDNHKVAMEKTLSNKTAQDTKRLKAGSGALTMDAIQWDVCHLPLRDAVVDVFVSDLPFGKRVGRKSDNMKLYHNVLDEMARVGKISGRAALLTGDINNMVKAIQAQRYWTRRRCYSCNIGGIGAAVFLLFRSNLPYTPRPQTQSQSRRAYPPRPSGDNAQDTTQSTPGGDSAQSAPVDDNTSDTAQSTPRGDDAQDTMDSAPVDDRAQVTAQSTPINTPDTMESTSISGVNACDTVNSVPVSGGDAAESMDSVPSLTNTDQCDVPPDDAATNKNDLSTDDQA